MNADAELVQMFIEEALELLVNSEQALLSLESSPHDEELIARVFRCAHTLKGNAKMLQFEGIAVFTHELENLLEKVRRGQLAVTKPVIEVLLGAFDLVKAMLHELTGGPTHDPLERETLRLSIEELVAALNVVLPSEQPPQHTEPRFSIPLDPPMTFRAPGDEPQPVLLPRIPELPIETKRATLPVPAPTIEAPQVEAPKLAPPKIEPVVAVGSDRRQFVTFLVGNAEYGLEILDVREFKAYGAITHVPNMPSFVRGVMNLRGVIIPVFDLRIRFGQDAVRNELTVIVVAEVQARTLGLVVDAVSDVIDLATQDISETPLANQDCAFLRGLAKLEDRLIMLLNLEQLVTIEERAA